MKKKFLITLSAMMLALAACGGSPEKSATPVNSAEANISSSISEVSSFSSASSDSGEQKIAITIINESTSYCDITCNPTTGYPGDDATFTVAMKPQYTKKSVSAFSSKGKTITLIEDGDSYTFVIPDDGKVYVEVRAEKIKTYQKLYVDDPKQILTANPAYVTMAGVSPCTDIVTEGGETYFNIETNSNIRFYFPNKVNYSTLGLIFNEMEFTPNNNNYIDLDFSGKTGDLRVEIFGKKVGSELHAVNSEHLTITFMNKSKTQVIDRVNSDTEYYVIITSEDIEAYLLDTLILRYTTANSTTVTEQDCTSYVTETATGYELLKRSAYTNTDDNGYTYTVTEDNLRKYIDEPFCGDFVAFTTFTYTAVTYGSNTPLRTLSIAGSGKTTFQTRSLKITSFDIDENGVYILKDRAVNTVQEMFFKENCLIAGYNSTQDSFGTPFYSSSNDSLSDDVYAVKMLPNTTIDEYELHGLAFTIDNVTNVIAAIYHENSLYKAIFTRRDTNKRIKEFHMDVDIDLMYGNFFYDNKSIFAVKEDGETLYTFGFSGNGGNYNRNLLPDYGGSYSDGTNSLVLCETVAIYNGDIFIPTLAEDGVTLTLKTANKTIVLTLDQNNKSFTIVSSESKEFSIGPFAGKKFRLLHPNGFDPNNGHGNYGYYIEFDYYEPRLSCVADIYYDVSMTSHSSYCFGLTTNAPYCFDFDTGKITAMILGYGNQYIIAEFTFENDAISFDAAMLSNNDGTISHNTVVCNELEAKLRKNNTEHLSISFKNADKTANIESIAPNKRFYIIITSEDIEQYQLNTINVRFTPLGENQVVTINLSDFAMPTEDGYEIMFQSEDCYIDSFGYDFIMTEIVVEPLE